MNAESAYFSCFFVDTIADDPKLANSDARVRDPVLFCIQTPVESKKESL